MDRLGELVPKPLVEIARRPIVWHVMRGFASQGYMDFALALGDRAALVKGFVLEMHNLFADIRVNLVDGTVERLSELDEAGWRITCVDTGEDTLTGTRLRHILRYVEGDTFFVAYCDGLANVDLRALLKLHRSRQRLATMTLVRAQSRFGEVAVDGPDVVGFAEKPVLSGSLVSAGFFVLEREAVERYVPDDADVMFEHVPLEKLVADGEVAAFLHEGFWQPMDTAKEHALLEEAWSGGDPPWRTW